MRACACVCVCVCGPVCTAFRTVSGGPVTVVSFDLG